MFYVDKIPSETEPLAFFSYRNLNILLLILIIFIIIFYEKRINDLKREFMKSEMPTKNTLEEDFESSHSDNQKTTMVDTLEENTTELFQNSISELQKFSPEVSINTSLICTKNGKEFIYESKKNTAKIQDKNEFSDIECKNVTSITHLEDCIVPDNKSDENLLDEISSPSFVNSIVIDSLKEGILNSHEVTFAKENNSIMIDSALDKH